MILRVQLLIISDYYTMCFDYIHYFLSSSQVQNPLPIHPNFSLKNSIKTTLNSSNILEYALFHHIVNNSLVLLHLKKISSPSLSRYKLSIYLWLRVGFHDQFQSQTMIWSGLFCGNRREFICIFLCSEDIISLKVSSASTYKMIL